MRSTLLLSLTLALAGGSAPALAQRAAPGLWEQTISVKTGSGQMEAAMAQAQAMQQQREAAMAQARQQMASLPPEQRKMAEEMMARQGAMAGPGMGGPGKPTTLRVCLTPEQAARDEFPQQDPNCKQLDTQRSGNVLRFKFSCGGKPPMPPTSGEGEFTFVSDKEHKGRITMNTVVDGRPERMEIQQTGRWLAADCGNVKPRP